MNTEFLTTNFIYIFSGLFIVVEFFILRAQKKEYPFYETLFIVVNTFLQKYFLKILFFAGYSSIGLSIYRNRLFTIQMNHWISICMIIFVVDFTYYWTHRAMHKVNFFWTMHSVHHLPSRLTFLTSVQRPLLVHVIPLFSVLAIPAILFGFSPKLILYYMGLNLSYQGLLHNEFMGKLGILERIFNTPAQHRIHHSVLPEHANKNFGGILCIFDRMFGTYHLDEINCTRFGVLPAIKITSPLTPALYEYAQFKKLALDIIQAPGLKNKISVLIKV